MSKEQHIDLDIHQLELIEAIIRRHIPGKAVWAYGSRVTWKADERSDLDLVVFDCDATEIIELREAFEESDLLISVDVMDWENIPENFKENIEEKYVVLQDDKPDLKDWQKVRLGDVVKSNQRNIDENYPYEIIEYLDTSSVTEGKFGTCQTLNISNAPSRAKRLVKNEDIIYSNVRPIQRHYGFIKNPPNNLVVSTGFSVIETDRLRADSLFVYSLLTSNAVVRHLDAIAESATSAYPSLRPVDIENLKILLPSLPEQKAIAEILSSLDDKIDLLHRQNKTLEDTAQALFRQWFVEEADEGWESGKLGDVFTAKGGATPSTKESGYWNGNIHWSTPRDLSNNHSIFLLNTERKITNQGLEKISSKLLPIGTILLSSRAPIGYLAIAAIPTAINQGYIAICCDNILSNYFVYLWCKNNMEMIKASGNGSVFQEISKTVFRNLSIRIPPKKLLLNFDEIITPIFLKVKYNQFQALMLEEVRDNLLPQLMAGDVSVAKSP